MTRQGTASAAAGESDAEPLIDPGRAPWGCARCAMIQRTCCQDTDVLLTTGDLARIARHLGAGGFFERRRPIDPDYLDQDDDPHWNEWTLGPDGSRLVVRQRASGDCLFLSPGGCELPLEVRPLVCRLQPYEYTERGLTGFDDRCPGAVIAPGGTLPSTLDLDEARAREWHRILYLELSSGHPVTPTKLKEDR